MRVTSEYGKRRIFITTKRNTIMAKGKDQRKETKKPKAAKKK